MLNFIIFDYFITIYPEVNFTLGYQKVNYYLKRRIKDEDLRTDVLNDILLYLHKMKNKIYFFLSNKLLYTLYKNLIKKERIKYIYRNFPNIRNVFINPLELITAKVIIEENLEKLKKRNPKLIELYELVFT
ncbi:MAG: hypothetical protein ACPL1F_02325 [bacterium]